MSSSSAVELPRAIYLDRIQIHSYPYASMNRDRNGSPKTALWGGVARGRLSYRRPELFAFLAG